MTDDTTGLISAGLFLILVGLGFAMYRVKYTQPIGSLRMCIPMSKRQWMMRTASPGFAIASAGVFLFIVATLMAGMPG